MTIKQIRLDQEIYTQLAAEMRPRETFSDCVARLLAFIQGIRQKNYLVDEAVWREYMAKGGKN